MQAMQTRPTLDATPRNGLPPMIVLRCEGNYCLIIVFSARRGECDQPTIGRRSLPISLQRHFKSITTQSNSMFLKACEQLLLEPDQKVIHLLRIQKISIRPSIGSDTSTARRINYQPENICPIPTSVCHTLPLCWCALLPLCHT